MAGVRLKTINVDVRPTRSELPTSLGNTVSQKKRALFALSSVNGGVLRHHSSEAHYTTAFRAKRALFFQELASPNSGLFSSGMASLAHLGAHLH